MKTKISLFVLLILISVHITGQNSQVLYHMNLPQNHLLNPALKPSNRVYIGLPVLSGVNINISNNIFDFGDVFIEGEDFSESSFAFADPDFDREKFLAGLGDKNYFNPRVSIPLLSVGFNVGKDLQLFIDIIDNAEVNLVLPKEFFNLLFLGNEAFVGKTTDLSDLSGRFSYYREVGIGASRNLTPKLRLGAKAKLLFGMTCGSFKNNGLSLTVGNDLTTKLNTDFSVSMSLRVTLYTDDNNHITEADFDSERFESGKEVFRYLTNIHNAGFGFDFGAEYTVNDKLSFSASVTDLGLIRWKSDMSEIESVSSIELSGLDMEDVYQGTVTFDEVVRGLTDSIKHSFSLISTGGAFTTKLPAGITLGGKYDLNDFFSVGIVSYSRVTEHQIREALSLSANLNFGSRFSAALAYTICNSDYSNIGIGIAARASVAQFYFLCDRIPVSWSRGGSAGYSVPIPSNWNTLNLRAGMNLVFGNRNQ